MSKNRFVFLVGVLILLLPFTGFPSSWKSFFHIIFGLVLVGLSFSSSIKHRGHRANEKGRARSPRRVDTLTPEKNDESEVIISSPVVEEQIQIEPNIVSDSTPVVEQRDEENTQT